MPRGNREPEQLIIRPPSEWRSLLIRVTRGCRWNRCRFCGLYPQLGAPAFSIRTPEEIKQDILLLRDRSAMLEEIDRFLSLPVSEREACYRAVGSQI